MGTAIFTGVTGLLAFQRRLDVIASNIANVNTPGYRGSRMLFQDLFSQTIEGARASAGGFGGTNPVQVGLGVRIATVDTDFGQGSLVTTGVASDLAIQGSGFFILSDGTSNLYTRDGSFSLNADGDLVDPATGLFVQGFQADSAGVVHDDGAPTNLSVPVGGQAIVRTTSFADLVGNLNAEAITGTNSGTNSGTITRVIRVYDSLGTPQDLDIQFTKRPQVTDGNGDLQNAWEFSVIFGRIPATELTPEVPGTAVTNIAGGTTGVLLFGNDGNFIEAGSVDNTTDAYTAGFLTADNVSVPLTLFTGDSIPVTAFDFNLDFNLMTQLAGESDVTMSNQDGLPRGVLESFNIGDNGTINGVFSNGLTVVIGQVALGTFANVGGLQRAGSNLFRGTPASGTIQVGTAASGGRGTISGGVLEGSNVDLATQFSNMIVTQRGFQANARTITAADTLLQEAVNLVR